VRFQVIQGNPGRGYNRVMRQIAKMDARSASRFPLHVLGAAAEFERSLIRERTKAGRLRYQQDYNAGKVGKTAYSRSGKNLPIGRPKRFLTGSG